MKSVLPLRGNDILKYSITYDLSTPESRLSGGYEESGFVVEPTEGELQDILLQANGEFGIYKPVGVGTFVNPRADHDHDYSTKGHEKFYTLKITQIDGTRLNQEQLDFIIALLNAGKYHYDEESNRFYEWGGTPLYGIGGWIGGTLIGGFLGFQIGKAVGYGRAYRGYEGGGEITENEYDIVVNNWVYFTLNYPSGWQNDAFPNNTHLHSKWAGYYDRYGGYGALPRFWTELDGGNRLKLAKYIKANYVNDRSVLDKIKNVSDEDYSRIVTHWTMFGYNYPPQFVEKAFANNNPQHFVQKFSRAYSVAGSGGAVNKFYVELSRDNQEVFADWVMKNYSGTQLEEGGAIPEGYHEMPDGTIMPDSAHYGLGGLLLAGGFGAYIGYKIGRARPQKKGFETEKKVARKIKETVKDLRDKKKPAKAYAGGGGVGKTNGDKNREWLSNQTQDYTDRILQSIADYYGTSKANIKDEVFDEDAEMLYEYIGNNNSLRRNVYDSMIRKYPNYAGGGGVGKKYYWIKMDREYIDEYINYASRMFGMFEGEIYTQAPNKVAFDTEDDMFTFTSMIENHNDDNGLQEGDEGYIHYEELFNGEPRENIFDKISSKNYAGGGGVKDLSREVFEWVEVYKRNNKEYYDNLNEDAEYEEDKIDLNNMNDLPDTFFEEISEFLEEDGYSEEEIDDAIDNYFQQNYDEYGWFTPKMSGGGGVDDDETPQDKLHDLVMDMSEDEYISFAYENGIDEEDADEMVNFIWDLSDKEAKDIIKKIHNGYYFKNGGETITKPRPTITPTETPVKPDKDNPYAPKVKPKPKADYINYND